MVATIEIASEDADWSRRRQRRVWSVRRRPPVDARTLRTRKNAERRRQERRSPTTSADGSA